MVRINLSIVFILAAATIAPVFALPVPANLKTTAPQSTSQSGRGHNDLPPAYSVVSQSGHGHNEPLPAYSVVSQSGQGHNNPPPSYSSLFPPAARKSDVKSPSPVMTVRNA